MGYNFERFTDVKKSFKPKVTIRAGGHLGISQAAAERYGIKGEGYFGVFFYDKDACVIGLKITQDKEESGAVKIQYRQNAGGDNAVIQASIKSFLDRYQINYSESTSYRPEVDEETGFVIIDLNNPLKKKVSRQRQKADPIVPGNPDGSGPF
jgi:hypothetical protein